MGTVNWQWIADRSKLVKWFWRKSADQSLVMLPGNERPRWYKMLVFIKACREVRVQFHTRYSPKQLPDRAGRMKFFNQFDEYSQKIISEASWFRYADLLVEGKAYVYVDKVKPLAQPAAVRLRECRRRYLLPGNSRYSEEVFLAHHGLWGAPREIADYIKDKIFIDAGAYIGDSALVLMEYAPEKVLSFELSLKNRKGFETTMKLNKVPPDKYEFIRAALGARPDKIKFADTGSFDTDLASPGNCECDIVPLDAYLAGNQSKVGLLKTDVEGSGLDVLKGAIQTIRRDRPVLSLAVYHSPEEFYQTRKYLENNLENYVYRMPRFSQSENMDIALFCWPQELGANRNWWWDI